MIFKFINNKQTQHLSHTNTYTIHNTHTLSMWLNLTIARSEESKPLMSVTKPEVRIKSGFGNLKWSHTHTHSLYLSTMFVAWFAENHPTRRNDLFRARLILRDSGSCGLCFLSAFFSTLLFLFLFFNFASLCCGVLLQCFNLRFDSVGWDLTRGWLSWRRRWMIVVDGKYNRNGLLRWG